MSGDDRSQTFADFFEQKILKIVENTKVDEGVYNGEKIVNANDAMFMSRHDIIRCMTSIKIKKL